MNAHTTNYTDTFIKVSDDCPAMAGEVPPLKEDAKSIATLQFELVAANPYRFTSDEIIFNVFAQRNGLSKAEYEAATKQFFSKGQPCLRSSPLAKRYGWGFHHDRDGKVALYGVETAEYKNLAADKTLKILKAMRSKKT